MLGAGGAGCEVDVPGGWEDGGSGGDGGDEVGGLVF